MAHELSSPYGFRVSFSMTAVMLLPLIKEMVAGQRYTIMLSLFTMTVYVVCKGFKRTASRAEIKNTTEGYDFYSKYLCWHFYARSVP